MRAILPFHPITDDRAAVPAIGVISDTHGLMRAEALAALYGSSAIIHAGDIGSEDILSALRQIAPVYAVRGNNDTGDWADRLPERTVVTLAGIAMLILHDLHELGESPDDLTAREKIHVVIAGHSHRPSIEERHGILFVNPGSAGPRRFRLPVSVARLDIRDGGVSATLIELDAKKVITNVSNE